MQRVVAIGKVRITTTCWIIAQDKAVLIYSAAEASNKARVETFFKYQLNGHFLYSITICML